MELSEYQTVALVAIEIKLHQVVGDDPWIEFRLPHQPHQSNIVGYLFLDSGKVDFCNGSSSLNNWKDRFSTSNSLSLSSLRIVISIKTIPAYSENITAIHEYDV